MSNLKKSICIILVIGCLFSLSGCRFFGKKQVPEQPVVTEQPQETPEVPVATPEPGEVPEGNPNTWATAPETMTPELEAEIKQTVAEMETENPMRDIIWFRIDCHDAKDHIYYSTKNMNLQSWIKTTYNEDRWQIEGDKVVNQECTLYITGLEGGIKTIIHDGDVFDTDVYTRAVAANGDPAAMSGASMEEYIANFEPGIEIVEGDIVVREKDANNDLAYQTVYTYDNGLLEEIIVIYYCRDEAVDSYQDFLESSGSFREVIRQGNILSCYKPYEEVALYSGITRGAMYQMLLAMSEGKEYVEVFDEESN